MRGIWAYLFLLSSLAGAADFGPEPGIDMLSYDIRVDASTLRDDGGKNELHFDTRVELRALQDLSQVRLHADPSTIRVQAVRDTQGAPVPFTWHGQELLLARSTRQGETVTLDFDYSVMPATGDAGFFRTQSRGGASLLLTRGWPYFTRRWLPSNDHPSDPARVRFELILPAGFDAVATGAQLLREKSPDGGSHLVFEQRQSTPVYAFQVIIGSALEREDIEGGATFYHATGEPHLEVYRREITRAARARDWLGSQLGPYEFDVTGFAAVPHPFSMETAGIVSLAEPASAVHEIAHHWWGDTVRIGHWGDLWISEGFATYFTGLFHEIETGTNDACRQNRGRLNSPVEVDPLTVFDQTPYCKGAAALNDLRVRVARATGDSALAVFMAIMRDVYQTYRFRALGSAELVGHLRETLASTLTRAGYPIGDVEAQALVDAWARAWIEH